MLPVLSGSVSVHTSLRRDFCPDGLPSQKGELAKSAVAIGCSASEVRNLRTMSSSDEKSRLTWMVHVLNIMSRPLFPRLGMYCFMILYRPFGITGVSSTDHLGWNPRPRNETPISFAAVLTWYRCEWTSAQVWWRLTSGAPESSNWPPGSSVTLWPFSLQPMMLPDSIIGSQSNLSTSACRSLLTCASYSIGRRFSSWYPNFSCSVPILHSDLGLQPDAM
mmetsp:Transcript_13360/g.36537  ORF Transcript_13360/g.36537 Transcript_13360/m.36537 type:complete len:220 (-) Transcript_13360:100-759(-)